MTAEDAQVRAARLALARALTVADDPGSLQEAEQQLTVALDADVGGPERWEVLAALADVAEARGDASAAAHWLLDAVLAASPPDSAALSVRALRLIEADTTGLVANSLPIETSGRLSKRAHRPDSPAELVRLAARLSLSRGEIEAAGDLSRQRETVGLASAEPDLQSAEAANRVLELLADGRGDEASVLAGGQSAATDPAAALSEALLLYARGDVQAAGDLAKSHRQLGDFAVVSVLTLLSEAAEAETTTEKRKALLDGARTAAARAARVDPAGGAPLLLRAQVVLEGGDQLSLGRELLETALKRQHDPERLFWWRIQEHARGDDFYAYFRVEVAAAQGRLEDVGTWAARYRAVGTTDAQDGRVAELSAEANHDPGSAADELRRAATLYGYAGETEAVVRVLRRAMTLESDVATGLQLAEALWSASFNADLGDDGAGLVAEGLKVLGTLEDGLEGSALRTAALLWGLLLGRRDELADAPSGRRWAAVPHLLAAARLDEEASYGWAHLAWALYGADLWWPAAWAAEKALALRPEDPWLKETGVVMSFNWFATLSAELETWLRDDADQSTSPGWSTSVRALVYAFQGRLSEALELVDEVTWDALWAQDVRLAIIAAAGMTDSAKIEIQRQIGQHRKNGRLVEAAGCALWVNPDLSRKLLEEAVSKGSEREKLAVDFALVELVTTDGREGMGPIDEKLRRTSRIYQLVDYEHLQLPILMNSYPEHVGLRAALDELMERARHYQLVVPRRPELSRELDTGETTCDDPDLERLVRQLLESAGADHATGLPDALAEVPSLPGWQVLRTAWTAIARDGT